MHDYDIEHATVVKITMMRFTINLAFMLAIW